MQYLSFNLEYVYIKNIQVPVTIMSAPRYCLIYFTVLIGFTSCEFNNEEELYPCNVNSVPVTYRETIATIITRNCDEVCHGLDGTSGIPLKHYDGLKNIADAGRLMGAIRHSPGFSPMPKEKPQLSECDISKIQKWIDNGAPYN